MPLIPCLSQVTTLSTPFEEDVESYSNCGWPAMEIWLTKLETYLQSHSLEETKGLLERAGLKVPGAAGQGGLLLSRGAEREAAWELYRKRLEMLEALGVGTLVVAVDFPVAPEASLLEEASGSIGEAAALAGSHGIRLALEFQKTARFCSSLDSALALLAHSGAANAGVCLDLFHYYTGPSKFEDLGLLTVENLAWVQVCDLSGTPRELATDSDRILVGDGDFQVVPILEQVIRLGYAGPVSLEVLNPTLWSIPADRLAGVALQAMGRTLDQAERAAAATGGDQP